MHPPLLNTLSHSLKHYAFFFFVKMIACLGRLGESLIRDQKDNMQSQDLLSDHNAETSNSLLNADAPPFDASKMNIVATDNIRAIPQQLPQPTAQAINGTVTFGLSDHSCLQWDGQSEYFYNTRTRELQPIPFVPLGLSAFSNIPQQEMFLVQPDIPMEDIHHPSYIKRHDVYKDHYEKHISTREISEATEQTHDCSTYDGEQAFAVKAQTPNDSCPIYNPKPDQQTDSFQTSLFSALKKTSAEGPVVSLKRRKSRQKKIVHRRVLKTDLVLPFQGTTNSILLSHSNIISARFLLCENTSRKNLMTIYVVNYNRAGEKDVYSFLTKGKVQRQASSKPAKNNKSAFCSTHGDSVKNPNTYLHWSKNASSKPKTCDLDIRKDNEWIDTTPHIRTSKNKTSEQNKGHDINKTKRSSEISDFDKILHNFSLSNKQVGKIEPKRCKLKTVDIQIHRDYISIIEKADACRKNPAARILLLQQALPLAEQVETVSEVNNRLVEMAELYIEVGEYVKAQEHAERVLNGIAKNADDSFILNLSARCLVVVGRTYESLVQPDQAKPYFDEALQVAKLTENKNFEASIMGHLGIVHELMGDYAKAFEIYDKTLQMAELLNNRRVLCETSANLGLAHLSIGELDFAERILSKNISVARSLRDYVILSRAMTNIAHVHLLKGNLDTAAGFHRHELEINEENQDSQGSAQAISCLGNVRKAQERYEEATLLFEEELCIFQRLGNESRIMESLGNCGTIYRIQKNVEKAREYHHKERQCAESVGDHVYLSKSILNLADVDITESMMNESRKDVLLRTAIERYNISLYLVCEGVPVEDRQLYMVKVGCCEAEWRALDGLEIAYRLLGDPTSAVWRADAKHLSIVTNILRDSFKIRPEKQEASSALQRPSSICLSQHDFAKNSHEKLLNMRLNVSEFIKPKFIEYNVKETMQQLGIDIVIMYSMFWDYGQELFAYVMHQSFDDWKVVPLVFSANSSKVLASEHGEYRSLLVGSELDMSLLPHSVYSMGEQLSQRSDSLSSCLSYLYDDFFGPLTDILDSLPNSETLCIVSDGLIANIPFSMLQDRKGKFLVERYAISTVPSLELLILLHKRHKEREISPNTDVLSLRYSHDSPSVVHECNNAKTSNIKKTISTLSDLQNAVEEIRSNITILCLPTVGEMKDDYTGAFLIDDERMSSQDIVDKWKSMHWMTVVFDGMSCFTYRVLHESTVSLTRAFLAVGADRTIGMLWIDKNRHGLENAKNSSAQTLSEFEPTRDTNEIGCLEEIVSSSDTEHGKTLSHSLLEEFVSAISDPSEEFCFVSKALRKFQIGCIHKGISRWEWGRFIIVGLP